MAADGGVAGPGGRTEMEAYLIAAEEIVITDRMHVQCDGGGGALGHPVEYLTLIKGGQAVCKYCDRRYVHKTHPDCVEIRAKGRKFAA
jgi:uncharacterized Zn-finger protein